ncbi:unnamed protein product [Urochloa decumbens]|uniref:Uncharacterized protein n=1 Tax=Urochloa decumbens TaxID=240449 RepID=A0ABC8WDG9_9POAL
MAAAVAKVLRGGRPGLSSQQLVPAIFRRSVQEGVTPLLLRRPGSSPAALAAGVAGRLMHTGSGVTRLPQQKSLPFGGRSGALSQGHKIVRMDQFSSRRSFKSDYGSNYDPGAMPWGPIAFAFVIGLALGCKK